jgi:two-component system sensor histidine kinase/response regulator
MFDFRKYIKRSKRAYIDRVRITPSKLAKVLHEAFCKIEPKDEVSVEEVVKKRGLLGTIKGVLGKSAVRRIKPNKQQSVTEEVRESADGPELEPRTFKTLVVEGNPANLEIVTESMAKLEQDCITATNGLEAVIEYKKVKGDFDIVFMDLQMLIMDGIEAAVEIRKFESENGISPTAIVAMTNASAVSPIAKHEAFSRGMNAYIMKPIGQTVMKEVMIALKENGRHALNEFE